MGTEDCYEMPEEGFQCNPNGGKRTVFHRLLCCYEIALAFGPPLWRAFFCSCLRITEHNFFVTSLLSLDTVFRAPYLLTDQ